jgi:hypothetical protein
MDRLAHTAFLNAGSPQIVCTTAFESEMQAKTGGILLTAFAGW